MDFYDLRFADLVLYSCVIVVFMAFALSGTLLVYGSRYVEEEDGGGLAPFVYKSVLCDGEALSFIKFISVIFHLSQTH